MKCAFGVGFFEWRLQRGKAVELDADGRVLDTFGSSGKGPGQFQTGHDIAVAPDGAVYVAEGAGRRVQKFVRKAGAGAIPVPAAER